MCCRCSLTYAIPNLETDRHRMYYEKVRWVRCNTFSPMRYSWHCTLYSPKVVTYKLVQHYAYMTAQKYLYRVKLSSDTFRWRPLPSSGKATPRTKKHRYFKLSILSYTYRFISKSVYLFHIHVQIAPTLLQTIPHKHTLHMRNIV